MKKTLFFSASSSPLSLQEKKELHWFANHHFKLDIRDIYLNRTAFSSIIADNEVFLAKMTAISACFSSLSHTHKTVYESQLLLAYYQLMGQYELDRLESRVYELKKRALQIKECARLINLLRLSHAYPTMDQVLLQEIAASEHGHYTHYLGLKLLTPALQEGIDRVAAGHGKSAHEFISFINERRLYWVWGGTSVATILSLLPSYLADTSNALYTLGWTGLIGGSLSWILYFTRAGIQWTGLFSHTLEFALSDEERALGFTFKERFKTQWDMRKYGLLNDTIWGACNFACFFVLVGAGLLGNFGNGLTAALLLMDVIITVYRMYEEEKNHQANDARYKEEIKALKGQIKWLKELGDPKKEEIEKLEIELQEIESRMAMASFNWEYQKLTTALDLLYATCLFSAFLLLCVSIFFAPHLALTMAVVGVALCFTCNLIYSGALMQMNVSKTRKGHHLTNEEINKKIERFIDLSHQREELNQAEMKLLYLNLMDLKAESTYQLKMIKHQRYQMITSTIRDAIIPPLFIVALVFLPLGIGLPLLVVSLTLAACVYWFYSKQGPEKEAAYKTFPELAFQDFCKKAQTRSSADLLEALEHPKDEVSPLKLAPSG